MFMDRAWTDKTNVTSFAQNEVQMREIWLVKVVVNCSRREFLPPSRQVHSSDDGALGFPAPVSPAAACVQSTKLCFANSVDLPRKKKQEKKREERERERDEIFFGLF